MDKYLEKYKQWMQLQYLAEVTITKIIRNMATFNKWYKESGQTSVETITLNDLEDYQLWLNEEYLSPLGKPICMNVQRTKIMDVSNFFKWLFKNNYIHYNPAEHIDYPKRRETTRNLFTLEEMKKILSFPDLSTPRGFRDRTMMEVFYSTGIRAHELRRLKIHDIDPDKGILWVILGKRQKDRVIPIGERALYWVDRYLNEARKLLHPSTDFLFVDESGKPFQSTGRISQFIAGYKKKAGIKKYGSCHLFRRSMATHMLEGGAAIRYIQTILGHTDLQTTQLYTKLTAGHLKKIHSDLHPAENEGYK